MLSRVAESMFWMSRYMERAENIARFLDVHYQLLLDLNKVSASETDPGYWEPLLTADECGDLITGVASYDIEAVARYLVFDRDNSNSIVSCVALARENARSIIESISSEMWEQVNYLYHYLQKTNLKSIRSDPYQFYRSVVNGAHLLHGITDNTLPRHEGWHFLQAGRYLERADNTIRLLEAKYRLFLSSEGEGYGSIDVIQWMSVLKNCCALEAFRKAHLSRIDPATILEFLVLDRGFPRSIHYSVSATAEALSQIAGSAPRRYANNADRLVGQLTSELSYAAIEDIFQANIREYLLTLQQRLARIGEQIHLIYFSYHAPEIEVHDPEHALPFTGLKGGRAIWSQAEQQQQQ
jgi:uncharacterized alpha-E superfamily protein